MVLSHTTYGKAAFTQSEFELHALSTNREPPKMVLSHIKYGKVGCDRDITPRLGVCNRDITTLSAHALIGHCLGNSLVTCQKLAFKTASEVLMPRAISITLLSIIALIHSHVLYSDDCNKLTLLKAIIIN